MDNADRRVRRRRRRCKRRRRRRWRKRRETSSDDDDDDEGQEGGKTTEGSNEQTKGRHTLLFVVYIIANPYLGLQQHLAILVFRVHHQCAFGHVLPLTMSMCECEK